MKNSNFRSVCYIIFLVAVISLVPWRSLRADDPTSKTPASSASPSTGLVTSGGFDSVVQVANLVYAGTKSSRCFADHFLVKAEKETTISTSRRFHAVKLTDKTLYNYPLVIMTGEGVFQLSDAEREALRKYIEQGGFLLASAGCSSPEWDRSFRREMSIIFADRKLETIPMKHPIFSMIYEIKTLRASHGQPQPLCGIRVGGRVGVIYSPDGLNDTQHTTGCCCCGGNELANAVEINVNILAYVLAF